MSSTTMHDGRVVLHNDDCRDVLRGLADNSIDSVVTDPPYALVSIVKRFGKPGSAPAKDVYGRGAAGFMGKQWDTGETAFSDEFWAEVLRVLKPGGHVVAFSGTRTYHRMAVAIEDAGFEIRDQLGWVYGSGFPKSHNQHDKWEGWGTALKPAWEPIALARKPLCGTVAGNLEAWGVGAINVDGCRNPTEESWATSSHAGKWVAEGRSEEASAIERSGSPLGRWPANIIHDGSDEVLAAFPLTGASSGAPRKNNTSLGSSGANVFGKGGAFVGAGHADNGGSTARFFYCAKASRADRDAGLESVDGNRANTHPTVKPVSLCQWLCRLVTPPGGTILDPFMGSGSTGKGAVLEGFGFVGIEREEEYVPIAISRIAWAVGSVSTSDEPKKSGEKLPANDNSLPDLFGAGQAAIGKVAA